jgi:uncharacterized protein (TIGR02145 family)
MKSVVFEKKFIAAMLLGTLFLAACGDDDSFAPVSRAEADQSLSSSSQGADGSEKGGTHSSSSSVDSIASLQNDKSSSSQGSSSSLQTKYEYKLYLEVKGEQFNPNIDYGTMTDPRDGKTYRTVNVEGKTWMAENLNYADHKRGESHCFDNYDEYCELFGRLYTRNAAMNDGKCKYNSNCKLGPGPIQGICPDGWHIPTYSETMALVRLAGKKAAPLASLIGWRTDSLFIDSEIDPYGLSFVAAGIFDHKYRDMLWYAYMWIYYESIEDYYLAISGESNWAGIQSQTASLIISVRCVKDEDVSTSSSSSSSSIAKSSSSSSRTKQEDAEPFLDKAGDQFNPDIDYGTMTDPRDGKTYRTVVVNRQTWMAENLNYAGNEIGVSACFNDEDRFCELYGRLYSRDAAMNSSICAFDSSCSLGSDTIQGICPDGWHIPSKKEAEKLISLASKLSDPLMSKKGWAIEPGTDTYGLSFVGSGRYDATAGFGGMGESGYTWIHYNSPWQYYLDIPFFEGSGRERTASIRNFPYHEIYCPIRCIKDE